MSARIDLLAQDLPGPMQLWRTTPVGGAIIMTSKRTKRTPATAPRTPGGAWGFEHPEGLRALLIRLHGQGPWAWQHDPEVAELMRHAADRYAALARRHGLDPWEAAAAAFDAMRTGAVRRADDPLGGRHPRRAGDLHRRGTRERAALLGTPGAPSEVLRAPRRRTLLRPGEPAHRLPPQLPRPPTPSPRTPRPRRMRRPGG